MEDTITPGQLLRGARARHGVSQKRLAIRAGTTQSAISRVERDQVSPSIETLRELLRLLGEDLVFDSVQRDTGIDRSMTRDNLMRSHAERVARGREWAEYVRRNRGSVKVA